jgi:hypothetical protein
MANRLWDEVSFRSAHASRRSTMNHVRFAGGVDNTTEGALGTSPEPVGDNRKRSPVGRRDATEGKGSPDRISASISRLTVRFPAPRVAQLGHRNSPSSAVAVRNFQHSGAGPCKLESPRSREKSIRLASRLSTSRCSSWSGDAPARGTGQPRPNGPRRSQPLRSVRARMIERHRARARTPCVANACGDFIRTENLSIGLHGVPGGAPWTRMRPSGSSGSVSAPQHQPHPGTGGQSTNATDRQQARAQRGWKSSMIDPHRAMYCAATFIGDLDGEVAATR